MNKFFMYQLLPHLPQPPQSLLDLIDVDFRPPANNTSNMQKRELINWRGYNGLALRNMLRLEQPFQSSFDQWIQQNITTDYMKSSLMYCHGSGFAEGSPSTGAHTDFSRDYVLMYNVRTGGDRAELCFWQQKGHPLIRDRFSQCSEYDQLEKVDSVMGPAGVWYIVHARILHSVENIDQLRLNLQISFDTTLPNGILSR